MRAVRLSEKASGCGEMRQRVDLERERERDCAGHTCPWDIGGADAGRMAPGSNLTQACLRRRRIEPNKDPCRIGPRDRANQPKE